MDLFLDGLFSYIFFLFSLHQNFLIAVAFKMCFAIWQGKYSFTVLFKNIMIVLADVLLRMNFKIRFSSFITKNALGILIDSPLNLWINWRGTDIFMFWFLFRSFMQFGGVLHHCIYIIVKNKSLVDCMGSICSSISCVSMGKVVNLTEPQFTHPKMAIVIAVVLIVVYHSVL